MSDFSGLLSSDYGFKPSAKSIPMSNSKNPPSRSSNSFSSAADRDPIFSDNIFSSSSATANSEPLDLDSIYSTGPTASSKTASDSGPVFDKPVYDDDIFDGVTGLKSNVNDDIFSSVTSPPKRGGGGGFDDLLGGFGKAKSSSFSSKKSQRSDFDDFLPGFGDCVQTYITGDRIVTDPLYKPFSFGRNLICVYSKKHMNDVPELAEMKRKANTRSLKEMAMVLRNFAGWTKTTPVSMVALLFRCFSQVRSSSTHKDYPNLLIRDHRSDWNFKVNQPIAGNYYPICFVVSFLINLVIYMQDERTEFSVLVDRSLGGSSIVDGQIELMLHKRLLIDDSRGVDEALNETVCASDECTGLRVLGKLSFRIDMLGDGAKWRRSFGQEIYLPLLLAFAEQDGDYWKILMRPLFLGWIPRIDYLIMLLL